MFDRWWKMMHPDDAASFVFHRGDQILARFVFAFEYLTKQQNVRTSAAIIEAYAAAVIVDPHAPDTRMKAERAWSHPAVQDLIANFRFRAQREAGDRIALRYAALLEDLLIEAANPEMPVKEKVAIADAVVKHMKLLSNEEIAARNGRARRAVSDAMVTVNQEVSGKPPSDEEIARFTRMLSAKKVDEPINGDF